MVVVDQMDERTLQLGKDESFFDGNDIVTPAVHDDRRAGLRRGCRRQAREIESRCHQKKTGGLYGL